MSMPAAWACTTCKAGSAFSNRWANSRRCDRFREPVCSRSKVDFFLFAMAYSLCILDWPGSAQLAKPHKLSGGVEPDLFQGLLATKQSIAATEVMLRDGHQGAKTLSTIACRPALSSVHLRQARGAERRSPRSKNDPHPRAHERRPGAGSERRSLRSKTVPTRKRTTGGGGWERAQESVVEDGPHARAHDRRRGLGASAGVCGRRGSSRASARQAAGAGSERRSLRSKTILTRKRTTGGGGWERAQESADEDDPDSRAHDRRRGLGASAGVCERRRS